MGALVYLTVCSMKNRAWRRLRRLREPRYLLGTAAGLFYFYSVFFRPRRGSPAGLWSRMVAGESLELVGAVLLFVVAAIAWVWPGSGKPALAFSRAEVQFLFPAPLTRRRLIVYRVLRSQIAAFGGSAIMTLLLRPGSLASGWTFFLGMSLLMATLNLHMIGVSLSRESLGRHGLAGLTRQWLPVAAVLAVLAAMAVPVALDWEYLSSLPRGRDVFHELQRLAGAAVWRCGRSGRGPPAAHGLGRRVLVRRRPRCYRRRQLPLGAQVGHRSRGLGQPRSDRPGRTVRMPAPKRARRMPTPFRHRPPGMAVLWKNLILLAATRRSGRSSCCCR